MPDVTTVVDDDVFSAIVEPLRGELTAHCYRMSGSVHDAEDLVQETYLRAWRAFDRFEERSSVRTWMYRIATNVCLTALDGRNRRPMPTGLGQPKADPHASLQQNAEITWLEPLPDSVVWGSAPADPAAAAVDRESVRLAFVAALQHLTPPQRAILILRDVLDWHASEVAELLGLSVAAVNSSLQRARAHVHQLDADAEAEPLDDERAKALLADYVAAFENYDVARIVELLSADAVWEMPPYLGWYRGAEEIGQLIELNCPGPGRRRPGHGADRGERPAGLRPLHASAGRLVRGVPASGADAGADRSVPGRRVLRSQSVRAVRAAGRAARRSERG